MLTPGVRGRRSSSAASSSSTPDNEDEGDCCSYASNDDTMVTKAKDEADERIGDDDRRSLSLAVHHNNSDINNSKNSGLHYRYTSSSTNANLTRSTSATATAARTASFYYHEGAREGSYVVDGDDGDDYGDGDDMILSDETPGRVGGRVGLSIPSTSSALQHRGVGSLIMTQQYRSPKQHTKKKEEAKVMSLSSSPSSGIKPWTMQSTTSSTTIAAASPSSPYSMLMMPQRNNHRPLQKITTTAISSSSSNNNNKWMKKKISHGSNKTRSSSLSAAAGVSSSNVMLMIPLTRWIRSCLIAGIPAYIVLGICMYQILITQHTHQTLLEQIQYQTFVYQQERMWTDRSILISSTTHIQKMIHNRKTQRQERILPPPLILPSLSDESSSSFTAGTISTSSILIPPYKVQFISEYDTLDNSNRSSLQQDSDAQEPEQEQEEQQQQRQLHNAAGMEALCGYLARRASIPEHNNDIQDGFRVTSTEDETSTYLYQDALNENPMVRVLITGILNPIGIQLALTLHQHCNVQVVIGIDSMMPNTILHRLTLLERIGLLSIHIPQLYRPIMNTYIGIDPFHVYNQQQKQQQRQKQQSRSATVLPTTGEMNLLANFHPTHIVHLDNYNLRLGVPPNTATPIVTKATSTTKTTTVEAVTTDTTVTTEDRNILQDDNDHHHHHHHHPRNGLLTIRSSLSAMEQILSSIAMEPDHSQRPHLLFLSAPHDDCVQPAMVHHSSLRNDNADDAKSAIRSNDDNKSWLLHCHLKRMDEVLAQYYYAAKGVYSVAMRLPNAVYGPWQEPTDSMISHLINVTLWQNDQQQQLDDQQLRENGLLESTHSERNHGTSWNHTMRTELVSQLTESCNTTSQQWDLIHMDDVIDAIIAAMQFRSPRSSPIAFELSSGEIHSIQDLSHFSRELLPPVSSRLSHTAASTTQESYQLKKPIGRKLASSRALINARRHLAWSPRIDLRVGIMRTLAWYMDRIKPFGPPPRPLSARPLMSANLQNDKSNTTTATNATTTFSTTASISQETGDSFLKRHGLTPCAADDVVCHGQLPFIPCFSECASRKNCESTMFDSIVPLVHEVTEGCDVVLYTNGLGHAVEDLQLQPEYMEEGSPLICSFAFVSKESPLVENVLRKVPDAELQKLGVVPSPDDSNRPGAFHNRKLDKLNGRLLFRGWILVWPEHTPEVLPEQDLALIKIAPGGLFAADVKFALFLDQSFSFSPTLDDVRFLMHEMHRPPWAAHVVRPRTSPKAKLLVPAEPERRAVILLSELKYQASSNAERLPSGTPISVYEATRFMRFENEEMPLGKEPSVVKHQREFYERVPVYLNRDHMRDPAAPLYRFEIGGHLWARTRWVMHDLKVEPGRQLRCAWYQEHLAWGATNLDQLSLAYVLAKQELRRRVEHSEPDEVAIKTITKQTEMKKLVSDSFEWQSLMTEANRHYTPYTTVQVLPFNMDHEKEFADMTINNTSTLPQQVPLFVRIMSDRIMSLARTAWDYAQKV